MRVLQVLPWLAPRYGGPAILVPQASAALAQRGHHVEIVTTNVDGGSTLPVPVGVRTAWNGATVTFHEVSPPRAYLTSWSMWGDLQSRVADFDVIHVHCLYRFHNVAAVIAARWHGVPYVIQAHGTLDPWHRRQRRRAKDFYHALIEDSILNGSAAIICTSERERRSIRNLGYRALSAVIPVGIDVAQLLVPAEAANLRRLGIPDDRQLVTFLGRITEKKGVPLIGEAFHHLSSRFPDAHLVLAGPDDSGLGRGVMAMLAGVGLRDRASLVGQVTGVDKRALLQGSAVFVLPSADESFGVAVAEAMAVGCPVVISGQVALEDVVRSERAGIVVERDPAAIADAISHVLANADVARAMGEAGQRIVAARFAWTAAAEQLEGVYAAALATRGRLAGGTSVLTRSKQSMGVPLRCLRCGALLASLDGAACGACGWEPMVTGGVPVLLEDATRAEHDEVDHHHGNHHKAAQAAHFDRADEEEFETNRPHGSPRLYAFLLTEKIRRAIAPIRSQIVGCTALTVCGGSGLDAEYLARAGADVITSDLSLGAATRAITRSDRYGLGIRSIVADVERLPFADRSVDLVAVHDGLHHLDDPFAGLDEMARVARRWVVVTEPAEAAVTRLAVRLGLALEREEAGNVVARMEPRRVADHLIGLGFEVLRQERYAMYYPHHPGRVFSALSRPGVFGVVRAAWAVADRIMGRFGNKMVVVAERSLGEGQAGQRPGA